MAYDPRASEFARLVQKGLNYIQIGATQNPPLTKSRVSQILNENGFSFKGLRTIYCFACQKTLDPHRRPSPNGLYSCNNPECILSIQRERRKRKVHPTFSRHARCFNCQKETQVPYLEEVVVFCSDKKCKAARTNYWRQQLPPDIRMERYRILSLRARLKQKGVPQEQLPPWPKIPPKLPSPQQQAKTRAVQIFKESGGKLPKAVIAKLTGLTFYQVKSALRRAGAS